MIWKLFLGRERDFHSLLMAPDLHGVVDPQGLGGPTQPFPSPRVDETATTCHPSGAAAVTKPQAATPKSISPCRLSLDTNLTRLLVTQRRKPHGESQANSSIPKYLGIRWRLHHFGAVGGDDMHNSGRGGSDPAGIIRAVGVSAPKTKATIPLGTKHPCSGGWMRARMGYSPSEYALLSPCSHL